MLKEKDKEKLEEVKGVGGLVEGVGLFFLGGKIK